MPRSLAIEILSDEYKSQLENQTALKYANESCEAKLSFTKELSDVKINSYEQEIEYLNKALESRNKMVLRENSNLSKSFNFIGGFASGAIITIAVLWSVNSVNGIQQ